MEHQHSPSVEAVQAYFVAHRCLFETLEAAAVAFDALADANALCDRLRGGDTEFPVPVPPQPAIVDPPRECGYLGVVSRADVPPEAAEELFADDAGEIVGPVRYAGRYFIYRILMPKRPQMTDAVYALCEAAAATETGRTFSVLEPGDQGSSAGT